MFKKITSWVGIATLGIIAVGSVVAVTTVSEHLHITIAQEGSTDEVDPILLLRDDVQALRDDYRTLVANLEQGVGRLARSWDEAQRAEREAAIAREHSLSEHWARVDARLEAIEASGLRGAEVDSSLTPAAVAKGASEDSGDPEPPERDELVAASIPTESATEPMPKKESGFLGFSLSTNPFTLDSKQRFEVIGSLSRVGFDAKSTLHDFTGVTSEVSGRVELALGNLAAGVSGTIEVDARSLRTGVEGRDDEMAVRLRVDEQPRITFELVAIDPTRLDREAMQAEGTATGTFRIAGQERTVELPVKLTIDSSRRLEVQGECLLRMTDFGIEPPSQLGMINVEDEVKVWLRLRARSVGPGAAHASAPQRAQSGARKEIR